MRNEEISSAETLSYNEKTFAEYEYFIKQMTGAADIHPDQAIDVMQRKAEEIWQKLKEKQGIFQKDVFISIVGANGPKIYEKMIKEKLVGIIGPNEGSLMLENGTILLRRRLF